MQILRLARRSSRVLLLPLALWAAPLVAQQLSISGTVTDIQDIPIADVTVRLTIGSVAGQRQSCS